MSLLWLDGFDGISSTTGTGSNVSTEEYLFQRYACPNFSGTSDPLAFSGWLNGQSLSFGASSSADLNFMKIAVPSKPVTVVFGFAWWPNNYEGTSSSGFITIDSANSSSNHLTFTLYDNAHIVVLRNNVSSQHVGTAQHCFRTNSWNFIEIKATIDNAVGAVEIRVNGETFLNVSAIDTQQGNDAFLDQIKITGVDGSATTGDRHSKIDDLYILDTAGSAPLNDFLGPTKIESLFPSAAGDSTDFTPSVGSNWDNVNEVDIDDDTTYNSSATSTNLDLFNADDLVDITGTIFGVQVDVIAAVTTPEVMPLIPKVKSSTTEGTGSTVGVAATDTYTSVSEIFEQDPDATAAWTVTTINAMQIGYEVG